MTRMKKFTGDLETAILLRAGANAGLLESRGRLEGEEAEVSSVDCSQGVWLCKETGRQLETQELKGISPCPAKI